MWTELRRCHALCGAVAALVIATSTPASAQAPGAASAQAPDAASAPVPRAASADLGGNARWALLDAIGYGGLGFALGLASVLDLEGDSFGPPAAAVMIVGATTAAGTVAGAIIGRRASRAYSEGRGVGSAHRAAVVTGALLGGGALGALAAVPLINSEGEGTFLGSDEQTLTLLILGGVALGGAHAWSHRGTLAPSGLEVGPTLSADRRAGLHLRFRF